MKTHTRKNVGVAVLLLGGLAGTSSAQASDDFGSERPAFEGKVVSPRSGDPFNPTGFEGEVYTGTIPTAFGPLTVPYQVLDAAEYGLEEDLAVFEGDIVLGTVLRQNNGALLPYSTGRSDTYFRWRDGVVPYEIDAAYSLAERQQIIAALDHWNAVTPYWIRPRSGEADFIRFMRSAVCNSAVGRQRGRQVINWGAQCGTGGAIHEIGHAVGLWHEQMRSDRDNFVNINWANVQPGQEFNFQTYVQLAQDGQDMFDYDFNSIMHYGSFAFSAPFGGPTITRGNGALIVPNQTALSQGDIAGAVRVLTKQYFVERAYEIVNVNSGKCLDVAAASRSNGAAVNQFTCQPAANQNQRWYMWTVPGTSSVIVINDWSGQCLDIPSWSLADGARLQQFSCHGFGNQQFTFSAYNYSDDSFRLRNVNSGKCLDVPNSSTASGVRIQQYTCHGGLNQRWRKVL